MVALPEAPTLDRNSPIPLYFQLRENLRRQIEAGRWRPGEPIPAETALESVYQVSRITVRRAVRELQQAGIVDRQRGRGTFVTEPKLSHTPLAGHTLTDSLRARGRQPGWRVLGFGMVPAPPRVAIELQIEPELPVFWSSRLRLVDDEPIGHLVAHAAIREEAIDTDALHHGRSLNYLAAGNRLSGAIAKRTIEAIVADADEAELLHVDIGTPMMLVRRTVVTAESRPLETFRALYRGDRFQYLASGAIDVSVGS